MLQYQTAVLDTCCLKRPKEKELPFISTEKKQQTSLFHPLLQVRESTKSLSAYKSLLNRLLSPPIYLPSTLNVFKSVCGYKSVCFFTCRKGSALRAEPYPLGWSTQNTDIMALQPAHSVLPLVPTPSHCPLCCSAVACSWAEALLSLLQQPERPSHQKQSV